LRLSRAFASLTAVWSRHASNRQRRCEWPVYLILRSLMFELLFLPCTYFNRDSAACQFGRRWHRKLQHPVLVFRLDLVTLDPVRQIYRALKSAITHLSELEHLAALFFAPFT